MSPGAVAKTAAQLVLSIGPVLRPEQIGPVPKNAIVVNQAPQLELMKKHRFVSPMLDSIRYWRRLAKVSPR